jgi:hypothetical protein
VRLIVLKRVINGEVVLAVSNCTQIEIMFGDREDYSSSLGRISPAYLREKVQQKETKELFH